MKQYSPFKKRRVSTYPNQYICEEKANGVICNDAFYPFQLWVTDEGDKLNKKGIIVYIKEATMSQYKVAADAGTYIYLRCYQKGNSRRLMQFKTPTLTDCGFMYGQVKCGFLVDNTVTAAFQIMYDIAPSGYSANVIYAEIDELPGNLNPKVVEE